MNNKILKIILAVLLTLIDRTFRIPFCIFIYIPFFTIYLFIKLIQHHWYEISEFFKDLFLCPFELLLESLYYIIDWQGDKCISYQLPKKVCEKLPKYLENIITWYHRFFHVKFDLLFSSGEGLYKSKIDELLKKCEQEPEDKELSWFIWFYSMKDLRERMEMYNEN